jgi:hypothetical protein
VKGIELGRIIFAILPPYPGFSESANQAGTKQDTQEERRYRRTDGTESYIAQNIETGKEIT